MATITNTIGLSGRDFPDPAAWFASIPSDLIAAGNSYVGVCYNDGEIVSAAAFTFSGKTADADHTITLKCAPGHSFCDSDMVSAGPLRPNAAKGVMCTVTADDSVFFVQQDFMFISGFQLRLTGSKGNPHALYIGYGLTTTMVERMMVVAEVGGGYIAKVNGKLRNAILVCYAATNGIAYDNIGNLLLENLSIVATADSGTPGIALVGGIDSATITNTAMFGFAGVAMYPGQSSHVVINGGNNASNLALDFGSANQQSLVTTNQFYDTSRAGLDLRTRPGSALIDNGRAPSAGNTTTISGPRVIGAHADIGAFEFVLPATALGFSGATGAVVGSPALITVTANGSVTAPLHVTLGDGGAGGSFNPASLTLTASTLSQQFTYTSASSGAKTISTTNDGGLADATMSFAAGVAPPSGAVTSQTQPTGQSLTVQFSTTGSPTSASANLTPDPDNPNGATARAGSVTLGTDTGTASFTAIDPGNYLIDIEITNAGGTVKVTGAAPLTVADVPVYPTASSTGFRVVSVGAGGKDYTSLSAFATYLATQNLVANGEILCAEVYNNQSLSGLTFGANGVDDTHYCLIRPVPGKSVVDLDSAATLDYGTAGIELTISTAQQNMVKNGVLFENFRVHVTGSVAGDGSAVTLSKYNQTGPNSTFQGFQRCRFLVDTPSTYHVIDVGNAGGIGTLLDSLVIFNANSPPTFMSGFDAAIARCTFARRGGSGNALGGMFRGSIKDCVFAGLGTKAVSSVDTTVVGTCISDNVADAGVTGFVVNTGTALLQSMQNDYRPTSAGPLIAAASPAANSTQDVRGHNRGNYPDLGAAQLSLLPPPPTGIVTSELLPDGQNLTIQFSTTESPTSGVATLDPSTSNPNGAIRKIGVVTLGTNTGAATWTDIEPGNYTPSISISGTNGMALVSGTQPVSIVGIGGSPYATLEDPGNITVTAPSAPLNVVATAGDGTIAVAFSTPTSNGGSAITLYRATTSTGISATGASSPLHITVPNDVTVTVTVQAQNLIGYGLASAPSAAVTPHGYVPPPPPPPPPVVLTAGAATVQTNTCAGGALAVALVLIDEPAPHSRCVFMDYQNRTIRL